MRLRINRKWHSSLECFLVVTDSVWHLWQLYFQFSELSVVCVLHVFRTLLQPITLIVFAETPLSVLIYSMIHILLCVWTVCHKFCLCLSAVNFQTHLSHEHIGTDLQDNHNLWVLIEAKDPDDEVCPGRCRIFFLHRACSFFFSLRFGKSSTLSHHFLHLKPDLL